MNAKIFKYPKSLLTLIIAMAFIILHYRGETVTSKEKTKLGNQHVAINHSRHYIDYWLSVRHIFEIGENSRKYFLSFDYEKFTYAWEGEYEPKILKLAGDSLFLVTGPYQNSEYQSIYPAYKSAIGTNEWNSVEIKDIPGRLLVRNIWKASPYQSQVYGPFFSEADESSGSRGVKTYYHKEITENIDLRKRYSHFMMTDTYKLWTQVFCDGKENEELLQCLVEHKSKYYD